MRGPVEQLGCARRPVKAEVAGSNPVGTARTRATSPGPPGQVAQSVERAAENRKVGGSIPSLPTTTAQVRPSAALAPRRVLASDSGILPASSLTAATGGRLLPPGHSPVTGAGRAGFRMPTKARARAVVRIASTRSRLSRCQSGGRRLCGGGGRRARAIAPQRPVCLIRATRRLRHAVDTSLVLLSRRKFRPNVSGCRVRLPCQAAVALN